jgi:branched-chain amino acid transport system substrate-binding protein
MMRISAFSRLAFGVSAFAMAAGLSLTGARAQDLTIVVAGPMTGPVASIGDQIKRGAQTAAKLINESGGVAGRQIKIQLEDDQCDPKQAVTVANRVVANGVKFVAGHVCSGSAIPTTDVYNENNVLAISPSSSAPALTEKGFGTIMRVYPRDDAQASFIAPWIAKTYAGKKVAVLHDKSAYGRGLATIVRDRLTEAGLKPVLFDGLNPGEKDYTTIVSKLKGLGVDLLYYGGYHTETGLIARQARDQNFKLNIATADALATQEFWAIAGDSGEGAVFTFAADPRRNPDAAKALEAFKAQNFEPEGFTLFSYAVIQTIAEGVKRAGSDDPKKVAAALKDGTAVDTIVGPLKFDAKGDVIEPRFDLNQWHAGKYAPIPQ